MVHYAAFVLVFIGQVLIHLVCCGEVPAYQINSLEYLFNSTHGEDWYWYSDYTVYGTPWNFTKANGISVNPCTETWQGITCSANCSTSEICNVSAVVLEGYNLVGPIPPQLGELHTLEKLSFYVNSLTGSIPTELSQLTSVSYLDVGSNSLTGSVPAELADLAALETLWVDTNQYSGGIPTSFGNFKSLSLLGMGSCCLVGSIPTELAQLSTLQYLSLHGNLFTGTTIPQAAQPDKHRY